MMRGLSVGDNRVAGARRASKQQPALLKRANGCAALRLHGSNPLPHAWGRMQHELQPKRCSVRTAGDKSAATPVTVSANGVTAQDASANPLQTALDRAQVNLQEKTQVREALEAEAQEVAQVCV